MKKLLLCLVLIFGLAFSASAGGPRLNGLYTNMKFGTEDLVGVEIFIVYSDEGYFATVQCAEGAVSTPVVVPVIVNGQNIEFTVPIHKGNGYSCPERKFEGQISNDQLVGHFLGMKWPGVLRRSKSYWQ